MWVYLIAKWSRRGDCGERKERKTCSTFQGAKKMRASRNHSSLNSSSPRAIDTRRNIGRVGDRSLSVDEVHTYIGSPSTWVLCRFVSKEHHIHSNRVFVFIPFVSNAPGFIRGQQIKKKKRQQPLEKLYSRQELHFFLIFHSFTHSHRCLCVGNLGHCNSVASGETGRKENLTIIR